MAIRFLKINKNLSFKLLKCSNFDAAFIKISRKNFELQLSSSENFFDKKIVSFVFFFKLSFFQYKFLIFKKKFNKILSKLILNLIVRWKPKKFLKKIYIKSFFLKLNQTFFLKKCRKKKNAFYIFKNFPFFSKNRSTKNFKKQNKQNKQKILFFNRYNFFFFKESDLFFYLNKIRLYFMKQKNNKKNFFFKFEKNF